MNTSSSENEDSPPRILIVEDKNGTVNNLTHKLERDIPGVIVDSADNVVDGAKHLNAQPNYDVVILDYMLPEKREDKDKKDIGDFTLAFVRNPATLVIHATAYPDETRFQQMVAVAKSKHAGPRLVVPKRDEPPKYWAQEVVDACAKHIRNKHSNRIRAEFERLFGQQDESERVSRSTGRASGGRGDRARSLDIAVFCDDAGAHWNDLDARLQKELEDTLGHVQDAEGHHYVGVVAECPPSSVEGQKDAP